MKQAGEACAHSQDGICKRLKQCILLVTQSCLTRCDPMGCGLPGSSAHGTVQARVLEWTAIPFSRGSFPPRDQPGSPSLQADSTIRATGKISKTKYTQLQRKVIVMKYTVKTYFKIVIQYQSRASLVAQ